jgi:hypothetical protein
LDEVHDRNGRLPACEAARVKVSEEHGNLNEIPFEIQRLMAVGIAASFRTATAKLVVSALALPVIGLHPRIIT